MLLVGLAAVSLLWPLLDVALRSFNANGDASLSSQTITLGHYQEVFTDSALRRIVRNTIVISFWATLVTTILAFPVAFLLSRLSRSIAVLILALILIPFWVSILVRLFALTTILGRQGVINDLLARMHLGGPYALLFNRTSTIIGMVAYLLPYLIVILYAGLSGIDPALTTAARTLGASGRQAFLRVYLPLARQTLFFGVSLTAILCLGFFLTPASLGGPQETTIPVYIQGEISILDWGTASATGVLLLVVTIVVFAIVFRGVGVGRLTGRESGATKGTVNREPLRLSFLTVALWAITVFVVLALLAPLAVIAASSFTTSDLLAWPPQGFTLKWFTEVLSDPTWREAAKKSAIVAIGTALLSTAVALSLARSIRRIRSSSVVAVIVALIYAPLVVPVILLAIGIFDVQARIGLLGTNFGLVLGHCVLALPLAFAVLSSALSNLDPTLETAAWTLGASKRRAFWRIVVPNIAPSIAGAFLIAFVTSWDEVVIAIFQTGFDKTLPVLFFGYVKGGVTPALAAAATILVAVALAVLAANALVTGRRGFKRARAGVRGYARRWLGDPDELDIPSGSAVE
jgi:putative spermidine/putrescine transport system permease protein